MNAHLKPPYGPWSPKPQIDPVESPVERVAQLRSLGAIAHLQLGQDHPLVAQLRSAETDPVAFTLPRETIESLPALTRRQLLSSFGAVNFPPRARART
jgi:hypothetical protein